MKNNSKKIYISYGKQFIDSKDKKLVSKSLEESLLTNGKFVKIFEEKIKKKVKSKFVLSCANGTAGLHLAFLSIGLKKNDIVIMPAINFIAAYSMANLTGAKTYLADVDPLSGQITPKSILDCIKKNKLKQIKAIITMYLGGYPTNNLDFYKIKKKYNCFLIEDACHAFGSQYKIKNKTFNIGSCEHSDLCVFSFHPVKPITTGEGGAVTTNKQKLANKLKLFRNHGIIRKKNYWDYDIKEFGYNYRLSDINCALGISQITKLNLFIKKRKKIFDYYKEKFFNDKKNIKIHNNDKNKSSYHLILLNINYSNLSVTKNQLLKFLNKKGIFPQYHYKPIYKYSLSKINQKNSFSGSEEFFKKNFSIPVYHNLNLKMQDYIIKNIINFIRKK